MLPCKDLDIIPFILQIEQGVVAALLGGFEINLCYLPCNLNPLQVAVIPVLQNIGYGIA